MSDSKPLFRPGEQITVPDGRLGVIRDFDQALGVVTITFDRIVLHQTQEAFFVEELIQEKANNE